MLSCYKATQLISLSHECPLMFRQRMALRMHLLLCSACRNFSKNSIALGTAMKKFRDGADAGTQGVGPTGDRR